MARSLNVKIVGDASSYQRALRQVNTSNQQVARGFRQLGLAAKVGIGAGIVGIALAARSSIKELVQQQKVMAQTGAVLKSTGGAANVTKKQVTDLSAALLKKTGIDDEVIQSGENMLLTFRGIRNEVGANNDIFTQATKIGLDMSTALEGAGFEGGNLKTTMIRLGKALNDPVQGMTALKRVGVTFTEDQKKTIKRLEETGHHLEAQKLILKELRLEFAGSAEAYGKTLPGRLTILRESLKNVGAQLIGKLVPAMEAAMKVGEKFGDFLGKIAAAPSLKVAFQITGAGLKSIGTDVRNSVQGAIGSVDWKPIGTQLAATIGSSIVFGANVLDNALATMLQWTTSHASQIAEVGAVIAANLVLTITDPAFWLKHWQLAIGVALLAFSGTIGKVAGRFGVLIAAKLGPVFERAFGEAALVGMKGIARLPAAIGDALALATSAAARGIAALVSEVARAPGLIAKVLRLAVVVTAFRAALEGMKAAWRDFEGWIARAALRTVLAILEPFSHLPGRLGAWARSAKNNINDELDKIKKRHTVDVNLRFHLPAGARGPVGAGGDGLASAADGVIGVLARKYANANASTFLARLAPAGGSPGGLKPMILDDLALGQSMGLSLSSGYRPGAITSTGHKSLHSVGQAIDMIGSAGAMANFAHAEAGRSGVAEVLYSPVGGWYPGVGWTRLSGKLRQDHFSHVHVGVRSGDGRVGVGDGMIAAPTGRTSQRPGVDIPTPSPLASLRRRIQRLRVEERKLKSQIASVDQQIRQIDKTKKKTKAQVARRKKLAAESNRLHARLRSVQAQLVSLNQRVQEVQQHDYSELPISIQLEQAQAALTETTADDVTALVHAQSYLEQQLRRPGITGAQRVQLLRALAGVRGDLASIGGAETGAGGGGTGGDNADLEAQLAQSNARLTAASESARLANAFVSTGVFGGGVGMGGSLGAPTIVFNNLIPDAEQIRRATAAIADGVGAQPYRTTSVATTGY